MKPLAQVCYHDLRVGFIGIYVLDVQYWVDFKQLIGFLKRQLHIFLHLGWIEVGKRDAIRSKSR
jgi:hypothetical protein